MESEIQMIEEEEEGDGALQEHILSIEWKKMIYVPIATEYLSYPVFQPSPIAEKCQLSVFVQGNLAEIGEKMVFVTVHDIGKNHLSFVDFVNSKPMESLKAKSIFVHICLPGQQPATSPLDGDFPTMDQLGDGLAQLFAKFNLGPKCIVIGEGAGADICCRFAVNQLKKQSPPFLQMHHPKLVAGIVLIHCTSTTHGILEHVREILMNLRLDDGIMNQPAWNYLLTYRFGNHNMDQKQKAFVDHVRNDLQLKEKNLSRYIYTFSHRNDFTHELKERMANIETVLVTGGKSAHNDNVQHMFDHMNKSKTSLLVAEHCVDVLEEAPEYVASALILLCRQKGIFPDLELPSGQIYIPKLTCASSLHQNHQQLVEVEGDWHAKSSHGIFSKCIPMN